VLAFALFSACDTLRCAVLLSCGCLVLLQVLEEFTQTFNFEGLSFETGLRMFLESFKLPGEAQKIDRIINCECSRLSCCHVACGMWQ
jgi:hypothetical protein